MLNIYRTSRGFGVHSPFAFNLITRVLRERSPYYSYEEVTETLDANGLLSSRNLHTSKLLMRLAYKFLPEEIILMGDDALKFKPLSLLIEENLGQERKSAALYFLSGKNLNLKETASGAGIIFEGRNILLADVENLSKETLHMLQSFKSARTDGMTFSSSRGYLLMVGNKYLPRQDFKLKF